MGQVNETKALEGASPDGRDIYLIYHSGLNTMLCYVQQT